LKLAIAEMYVNGVSTRRVSEIVEKLCGAEISSTQVSKAAQLLDEEIETWRNREIGQIKYLILDATYESVRMGVSVVSGAVLVTVGVTTEGKRRILGVSTSVSEAEVHWRTFLQSLLKRGLHGVELISSDDHSGLRAAMKSCFPGVPWNRCQFHLQQNAQGYVPKVGMRKEVARDIRTIFRAPSRQEADRYLNIAIEKYRKTAPKLSDWMEKNIPEGLEVFQVPYAYQRFLRTTNMVERQMKEIKRRTRVAMVFPNEKSLLRLVSAILMEVDEQWQQGKRYLPVESE
jgi:putative transposase